MCHLALHNKHAIFFFSLGIFWVLPSVNKSCFIAQIKASFRSINNNGRLEMCFSFFLFFYTVTAHIPLAFSYTSSTFDALFINRPAETAWQHAKIPCLFFSSILSMSARENNWYIVHYINIYKYILHYLYYLSEQHCGIWILSGTVQIWNSANIYADQWFRAPVERSTCRTVKLCTYIPVICRKPFWGVQIPKNFHSRMPIFLHSWKLYLAWPLANYF